MSEGGLFIQVAGAGLIALGLLAMLIGFFRVLFRTRQDDGKGAAYFGFGAAAIVLGTWLLRRDT